MRKKTNQQLIIFKILALKAYFKNDTFLLNEGNKCTFLTVFVSEPLSAINKRQIQ